VPAFAVVAPTVPLMLIDAVPVKLVTTPAEGVPRSGVIKVGLVITGLLFITTDPVPVIGLLTNCFVELLNTAKDPVKLETIRFAAVVVLPLNVRFASPPNAPPLLY
jgi:hypothetical protein